MSLEKFIYIPMTFVGDQDAHVSSSKVYVTLSLKDSQVIFQIPGVQLTNGMISVASRLMSSTNIPADFLPGVSYIEKLLFPCPTVNNCEHDTAYRVGAMQLDCQTGKVYFAPDITAHDNFLYWDLASRYPENFGTTHNNAIYTFTWSV